MVMAVVHIGYSIQSSSELTILPWLGTIIRSFSPTQVSRVITFKVLFQ